MIVQLTKPCWAGVANDLINTDATTGLYLNRECGAIIINPNNVPLNPSFIDGTSATIIYEAYGSAANCYICKIDLTTAITSRAYAVGAWSARAGLTYV